MANMNDVTVCKFCGKRTNKLVEPDKNAPIVYGRGVFEPIPHTCEGLRKYQQQLIKEGAEILEKINKNTEIN